MGAWEFDGVQPDRCTCTSCCASSINVPFWNFRLNGENTCDGCTVHEGGSTHQTSDGSKKFIF